MAVSALINTLTLVCIGWALWVRRITWTCRWELAATTGIALQGTGLFLSTPAGRATVGRLLHAVTGYWNLAWTLGHVCLVIGACAVVYSLLSRLSFDEPLHQVFKVWIRRPTTVALLGLMAIFTVGGFGAEQIGAMESRWVHAYWATLSGIVLYLQVYACKTLLVLRQFPRHRPVANLYIVACASGALAAIARIVKEVVPEPPSTIIVTVLVGVWLAGFALVTGYSWQQKTNAFKNLKNAVS